MNRVEIAGEGRGQSYRLIDEGSGTSATIFPQFGFNCASFVISKAGKSLDLLYAEPGFPKADSKATANGTPILVPFPNRIREGRFQYRDREYQLPINHGDNAIHGLAVDQPWRVVGQDSSNGFASVKGEFQLSLDRPDCIDLWPADFRATCEYRLRGCILETHFEVTNVSDKDILPFGLGTHPYFRFPLGPDSTEADCFVESLANKAVELIDCLPTGQIRPVTAANDLRKPTSWTDRKLDDVYTDLIPDAQGVVTYRLEDRRAGVSLKITHGPEFQYCVLFVPPHRKAICIEPYTCVTDAINLEGSNFGPTGLLHLKPGESEKFWIRYEVEI